MRKFYSFVYGVIFIVLTIAAVLIGCGGGGDSSSGGGNNCSAGYPLYCASVDKCCPAGYGYYCDGKCLSSPGTSCAKATSCS
jgi:hypothetical protein